MRGVLRAGAAALIAITASACSMNIQDITLPGGADLGDHPYTVTVQFADVLNLVPQASVKVNDVAVGRVKKVSLPRHAWQADVTLLINGKVQLPANATANLEQSSLLGEKYIQLAAPKAVTPSGTLGDGATIPLSATTRNPETEEVFGALSMLLSGGGLPQLRTITRELNKALGGNETQIRSALRNVNALTTTLDGNRRTITDALDGLNRLSATVAARKGQVGTVLTDLSPGLKVLAEQRGALVGMLRQLEDLSAVAVRTINRSKDNTVADLRALAPTLRKLADAGRDLPRSLQVLLTFPFTDEVLRGIKGDYLNGYLTVTAAPDNDCVIPPVEPGDPNRLRAQGLLVPPQGPLPVPCPVGRQPTAGSGQAGSGQAGPPVGNDGPPLPLPDVELPPVAPGPAPGQGGG